MRAYCIVETHWSYWSYHLDTYDYNFQMPPINIGSSWYMWDNRWWWSYFDFAAKGTEYTQHCWDKGNRTHDPGKGFGFLSLFIFIILDLCHRETISHIFHLERLPRKQDQVFWLLFQKLLVTLYLFIFSWLVVRSALFWGSILPAMSTHFATTYAISATSICASIFSITTFHPPLVPLAILFLLQFRSHSPKES